MRDYKEYTILSAQAATGVGKVIDVSDFTHAIISVATDGGGTANLTCKFQGAVNGTAPDFSAAQSVTNMWDFIQVKDLEDGSSVDGDVGFAVAGADDYRQFEYNFNGLKYITARVTAYSAGSVTVKVMLFNNK